MLIVLDLATRAAQLIVQAMSATVVVVMAVCLVAFVRLRSHLVKGYHRMNLSIDDI